MTAQDLLEAIGEADDRYIIEAGRRQKDNLKAGKTKKAAGIPAPKRHRKDSAETASSFAAAEEAEDEEDEEDDEDDEPEKPQKSAKRLIPLLIAACLVFVVVCSGGGAVLYGLMNPKSGIAVEAATVEAATAEGTISMEANGDTNFADAEAEVPAEDAVMMEGAEAEEAAPAWEVTTLAQAAVVKAPTSWDEEHQISADAADEINTFSYQTAAAILGRSTDSMCFSPLSLYHTLAVLASGASGETRDQILGLMGVDSLDTLEDTVSRSLGWNSEEDEDRTLKISNSLWLDDTTEDGTVIEYNQDWVMRCADRFYADVYAADFSDSATAGALGSWIAEKTGGLLSPGADELNLDSSTVMAILNTVWYKAQWQTPFAEEDNTEDTFATENGDITCTFMHRTDENSRAVKGSNFTKSRLPLNSGRIIIVLPDEGEDINDFLTEDKLTEVFEDSDYVDAEVVWSVPKFDISSTMDNLPAILTSMGVENAFSQDLADFSEISSTPLYVSMLQQGTRISLDESGIEAGAYTAAGIALASEYAPADETVEMNLNRPFLYLITADDGSTLFMGVVRNPQD